MPVARRKDPVHLYYNLVVNAGALCAGYVGGCEPGLLGSGEPTVRYHPVSAVVLTSPRDPGKGHSEAGSLTGAVAS